MHRLDDTEIFLHLWDCGSQRMISDVLPSLLFGSKLFLLVFDASKLQSSPGKRQKNQQQREYVLSFLRRWIAFVHGYFQTSLKHTTETLYVPPIILVGTHADQLIEREKTAKEILDNIYLSIVGEPYSRMVLDGFIVDTTKRGEAEDKEVSKLRKTILQFTQMDEYQIPSCWIPFRNALVECKQNRPVISLDEVKQIATRYNIPKEDVPNALFYFNTLSVFFFFPTVEVLKEVVFLEPQWVFECFKKVLCYENTADESDMKELHDILTRYGILLEPFYSQVLLCVKDHIEPQCLVDMLCGRYLAAPVSTSFHHKWIGKKEYFLPFMVGENVPKQNNSMNGIVKASSLHIIFNDEYVPPGYFVQLVCYLATIDDIFRLDHSSCHGRISFHVHSVDHVTIMEHAESIEVSFVRLTPSHDLTFRESCARLISYLTDGFEKLEKTFSAACGSLVLSCPCCNEPAFGLPYGVQFIVTFWSEIKSYYQCQNDHHFLLGHSHRIWMEPLVKDQNAAEARVSWLHAG